MRDIALFRHFLPMIVLLFGLFAMACYAAPVYAEIPVAQVVWVKGTIKAISQDKKERVLKRSDFIYEHDTLKTDEKSSGQIVFSDSGLMSIRESSEFKIDTYKYSKDGAPSGNKFIGDLVKGGFRTVTGAISKDHPENYQVNTPVATIGVRGTEYVAFVTPGGELQVAIERGAIQLRNAAGSMELSVSGQLYATVKSKVSAPTASATQPAGLKAQPAIEPAKPSTELNDASATPPVAGGASGAGGSGGTDSIGGATGGATTDIGTTGSSTGAGSSSSGGGGGGGCGSLTIGG